MPSGASGGYDGTIRIDTKLDQRGFQSGISKLSSSIGGVLKNTLAGVATVGLAVASLAITLATIGVALIAAGVIAFKFFDRLTSDLAKSLSGASAYRDQILSLQIAFDGLKGAITAVGVSLLTALSPVLMKIIDWLIQAVNWVNMFIAALSGATTYARYVSGAASDTAKGTGQAAKNTEKMAKAAKGALASFDQLNVLQMESNDSNAGGAGGGTIKLEEVPIDSKILEFAVKIRTWFINAWAWIKQAGIDTWNWITTAAVNAAEWIVTAWENVKQWFITAWENIKLWAGITWAWIKQAATDTATWVITTWENVKTWFATAWENIKQFAINAWNSIQAKWAAAKDWFKTSVLDPIVGGFKQAWENIKTLASDSWSAIKNTWNAAGIWFKTYVTTPIKDAFKIALDWIKEKWEKIFGGVKDFTKNTVNTIIDFINAMIRALVSGINTVISGLNSLKITIPKWVPVYGGNSWGMNLSPITAPQIPKLAKGAVIPANSEFLAILGDQRSGRNIETPEGLLRQIVDEAMQNQPPQEISIRFEGTLGALVRELKPIIERENRRQGNNFLQVA